MRQSRCDRWYSVLVGELALGGSGSASLPEVKAYQHKCRIDGYVRCARCVQYEWTWRQVGGAQPRPGKLKRQIKRPDKGQGPECLFHWHQTGTKPGMQTLGLTLYGLCVPFRP